MKRNFTTAALMLLGITLSMITLGQNIGISFSCTVNDFPVQYDSIKVINLSRDVEPAVLYGETRLILTKSLGLEARPESPGEFSMTQTGNDNGQILFCIFLPAADNLQIGTSDLLGRSSLLYQSSHSAGYHAFRLNKGSGNLSVLTAYFGSERASMKIMDASVNKGMKPSISYDGLALATRGTISATETIMMPFELGDELYFACYKNGSSEFIMDTPDQERSYVFKITTAKTCPGMPTVVYAGKTYNTVQIGTQCWLKENMDIGTMVTSVYDSAISHQETSDNEIIEKYCYNNNPVNCAVYGGLYNWCEAVQYLNGASDWALWNPLPTGKIRGICPEGFHIPSNTDWSTLTSFLGGDAIAGGKMKEKGHTHWLQSNTAATNSSGFTALGTGYRTYAGNFVGLKSGTMLWADNALYNDSTYQNLPQPALVFPRNRNLSYSSGVAKVNGSTSTFGMSVRCLKD